MIQSIFNGINYFENAEDISKFDETIKKININNKFYFSEKEENGYDDGNIFADVDNEKDIKLRREEIKKAKNMVDKKSESKGICLFHKKIEVNKIKEYFIVAEKTIVFFNPNIQIETNNRIIYIAVRNAYHAIYWIDSKDDKLEIKKYINIAKSLFNSSINVE